LSRPREAREAARDLEAGRFGYHDRQRVAKRRMVKIQYARKKDERRGAYVDPIKYTRKTLASARTALEWLKALGAVLCSLAMLCSLS